MVVMSRTQIEYLSRKLLSKYLSYCIEMGQPVPRIDPVAFADWMCGLKYEFHRLTKYGTVCGITSFYEIGVRIWNDDGHPEIVQMDGKTAFIDLSLQAEEQTGRRNFTMMHEAAHHILAARFPREYGAKYRLAPAYCLRTAEQMHGSIVDWEEWQTNVLTSYLLLPRELVVKTMRQFNLSDGIRLLNKVFAPDVYKRFSEVAQTLGVSKTALSIRLKQLGMVGRCDLGDPYALVRIYPDERELA